MADGARTVTETIPGLLPPEETVQTVPVLLPLPLDEPFDYAPPGGPDLPAGSFVEVPFGPRHVIGVVWDAPATTRVVDRRLKAIRRRIDAPPMPPALRQLVRHIAATTLHPLGSALKLAISVPAALEPPVPKQGLIAVTDLGTAKLSPARQRVLAALADGTPRIPAEIARAAGVGAGVLKAMSAAGLLRPAPLPEVAAATAPAAPVALSPDQAEAAQALCAKVAHHDVTLLEGVPGAGKTEVYLEAVAAVLATGRQVLVLLPEIALSGQLLERFARRFGTEPAVWHSELGAAARKRTWRRVAEGREPVVIGARSALFLPFPGSA